ncbi:MAG: PEP-utilizing enzyme [Ignavibacteriaceae bacterium]|nr:hypothetical protein [Ignavibacteria bacterium]MEB2328808.1 PEP-utilizing enzyme [Ignavibacteriaceae bacterium]
MNNLAEEMVKPTLNLLGGLGSSAEYWKFVLPHFSKYTPTPIELPGFGNNKSDSFRNNDELARSLINLTKPGEDILACGFGALVALRVATIDPYHFRNFIILAPIGAFIGKKQPKIFPQYLDGIPFLKFLISVNPSLLKKYLTIAPRDNEIFEIIARGIKNYSALKSILNLISPVDALDLFDYIDNNVRILWGAKNNVIDISHIAAWDSILKRANLSITIKNDWGHFPYFDDPPGFVKTVEDESESFKSHTKAGRLKLAKIAGLNVPEFCVVEKYIDEFKPDNTKSFVIRSGFSNEDKADSSEPGLHKSFLRIRPEDVEQKVNELFSNGADEVIIQKYIEPLVSGVAFVRNISTEIEWVNGHLEGLTSGKVTPQSAVISKMQNGWEVGWNKSMDESPFIVMISYLNEFLLNCISKFHYEHCNIEWAWDGLEFYLLQLRPVTNFGWRRLISSANLDEILPKQVSNLMNEAQIKAAKSIGRLYALWDYRTIENNEPFTVEFNHAQYINCDLFLSSFKNWGLPAKLFFREIGGYSPEPRFNFFRFILTIPKFIKMLILARQKVKMSYLKLLDFEVELNHLLKLNSPHREYLIRHWFIRYYLFITRTNIVLKACLSSAGGNFMGNPKTVYSEMLQTKFPHRVKFESDPASERKVEKFYHVSSFPKWNLFLRIWSAIGLPGMRGRYIEIREWYRDNNMRLIQRLHFALKGTEAFGLSEAVRLKSGTFWQNSGVDESADFNDSIPSIIYPGDVIGIIGKDILIVDALEPGHFEEYKNAKAVIARNGGMLSHGAILLREIKKPSAIISNFPDNLSGKLVNFKNGVITLMDNLNSKI